MKLLNVDGNGGFREYKSVFDALAGIRCDGILLSCKDIKDLLRADDEVIRSKLAHLSTKFAPEFIE